MLTRQMENGDAGVVSFPALCVHLMFCQSTIVSLFCQAVLPNASSCLSALQRPEQD